MTPREKAWRTRRERYGPEGHSRYAYARRPAPADCQRCCSLLDLVIRLHREGVLSEGQVAQASGLDRVTIRRLVDEDDAKPPPSGLALWAAKRRNP